MAQQRSGEGAVAALAVERDVAGLSREGDHHADRLVDPRKAAADLDRAARCGKRGGERVVAAGIEEYHRDAAVALELFEHEVELDGLEVEIGIRLELGVHRREEVLAVDLEAVPGIEEKTDVGAGELGCELSDALLHLVLG